MSDPVKAEVGSLCCCGNSAAVCDLDSRDETTDFYCADCFWEAQVHGAFEGWTLTDMGIYYPEWVLTREGQSL